MRLRKIIFTLAGVALMAGSTVAVASGFHGRSMGARHGALGPLRFALHHIDLSDAQKTAIQGLVEQQKPAIGDLWKQLRDSRDAFRKAHPPTEFDEAAIRAQAAAEANIRADLAVAMAKLRADVLAQLTSDQLSKLQQMRGRFQERRQSRRGNWGGGSDD